MNDHDVAALLDRAAASVTPTLPEPGARLAERGRLRERRRRRRAWEAGGVALVAAAVLAWAAPAWTGHLRMPPPAQKPVQGTRVSYGALTVTVPGTWRVRPGADVDVCTARPRTLVTGWLHKRHDCALPDPVVLVSAEPLVVGEPTAEQHQARTGNGRTVTWQQTWIRGNLLQTRIDGYLVVVPDGREVFVVTSSPRVRDDVIAGLSW